MAMMLLLFVRECLRRLYIGSRGGFDFIPTILRAEVALIGTSNVAAAVWLFIPQTGSVPLGRRQSGAASQNTIFVGTVMMIAVIAVTHDVSATTDAHHHKEQTGPE
jgi:hypothetical protein